ncbi:MAG: penicillin-binding transpeptidase domain-containing protein [Desulfobacterales bacterium]|jgi:cell division protein FtsI/penicillin-binding protein 2
MLRNVSHGPGWRTYQERLQREERIRLLKKKLLLVAGVIGGLLAVVFSGAWMSSRMNRSVPVTPTLQKQNTQKQKPVSDSLSRKTLAALLVPSSGDSVELTDEIAIENKGVHYTLKTTVNPKVQTYVDNMLERSKTLQAAVVVLNPHDGRVLVMSGHGKNGDDTGLCLKAEYPAASLFKIVSAAAALEAAGYTPEKTLYFNGSRHTLYKNQLKQQQGRYTSETKLRKAFAVSNNSIFGKLGIYALGPQVITEYAEKFYFNRPIPFDLPVEVSETEVPKDEYGLAEIASGFNKRTRVSPLHAALLACTIVNQGEMVAPWLIETVTDASNSVLYQAKRHSLDTPVNKKTAADLKLMMEDAAAYGTGRKTFRKLRRRKIFKNFALGVKTGTINDVTDQFKYDWAAAFALAPNGKDGICIGVVAVHGEKLGIRATEMARAIIDYNFRS